MTDNKPTTGLAAWFRRAGTMRDVPAAGESWALGVSCILLVLLIWQFLTFQWPGGDRIIGAYQLPSPKETFSSFPQLWNERELSRSILWSLGRVLGGFTLAAFISVPLGLIAGSYLRVNAFLKPLSIFGRNVPVAALIALTMMWFGLGEVQKVMFIFIACVAFVLFNTTTSVQAVHDRYLDTAYTLGAHRTRAAGAKKALLFAAGYALIFAVGWFLLQDGGPTLAKELAAWPFWRRALIGFVCGFGLWYPIFAHQALSKVLMPLAMPDVANNLRLLFGLAFGYIMLAEAINAGRGLGFIISTSERRGPREHVYLCLIIISLIAWLIDRFILWAQRQLFPYLKHAQS